ncbi:MAG: YfcC family protein, partial [Firmicutes bacterium]|nr:YfcC family protein [Bacillota bacterium]
KANAEPIDLENVPKLTVRQILVLLVFMGGFVAIAFLVITQGYYMDELSALFIIMGLLSALIGGIKPNEFATSFVKGAKGMMYAGLMVGLCRAATNIMSDAKVFDTIINGAGTLLNGLNTNVAACGMYVFHNLFDFLVPSGSGQASITMPFMAPLADLLGMTRQTATLAFHMGDGFTNCITPTSGSFMAALAMAKIPWGKWFRYIAPLWAMWAVIACVFMVVAVNIGYGPF